VLSIILYTNKRSIDEINLRKMILNKKYLPSERGEIYMCCWWIALLLLFDGNDCGNNDCCCNTFIINNRKKCHKHHDKHRDKCGC
jgi:hypothetical protein